MPWKLLISFLLHTYRCVVIVTISKWQQIYSYKKLLSVTRNTRSIKIPSASSEIILHTKLDHCSNLFFNDVNIIKWSQWP